MQTVRALDEKAKQGDLAGAVGDARKTQAKIDAASARVDQVRATIARAREGLRERLAARSDAAASTNVNAVALAKVAHASTSANAVALADQYLARLRRDLEAAEDELDRATAAHRGQLEVVDAARARLGRARADKEVIERHFEKWRIEKRKLAERRED